MRLGGSCARGAALFADDTPVKMLAPGNKKTKTARVWTYGAWMNALGPGNRRPVSGTSSRWTVRVNIPSLTSWATRAGCMRMDTPGSTGCSAMTKPMRWRAWRTCGVSSWMFSPRKAAPIAEEAIRRIALLYAIEKEIRGMAPEYRAAVRQARAKPIFDQLEEWLHAQLAQAIRQISPGPGHPLCPGPDAEGAAISQQRPLDLDNNAAERAVKPVAIGRKNWMFQAPRVVEKPWLSLHADRNRQTEQRRPPGLAHLGAGPNCRITRSLGWTSCSPGVTLPKQRNRSRGTSARAATPDGHPQPTSPDCSLSFQRKLLSRSIRGVTFGRRSPQDEGQFCMPIHRQRVPGFSKR